MTRPLSPKARDALGRMVRQEWIAWAKEQPSPKPSWLVPWDELAEPDREVDRRIGERLWRVGHANALPLMETDGATETHRSTERMTFEYKVVRFDPYHADRFEEWVNEFAAQGWRLVAVSQARHYFERPVVESAGVPASSTPTETDRAPSPTVRPRNFYGPVRWTREDYDVVARLSFNERVVALHSDGTSHLICEAFVAGLHAQRAIDAARVAELREWEEHDLALMDRARYALMTYTDSPASKTWDERKHGDQNRWRNARGIEDDLTARVIGAEPPPDDEAKS